MVETWRHIPGYLGLYEVSDRGRVRSLDRRVNYRDGRSRFYPGQILEASTTPFGYKVVTLSNGKASKQVRTVHRLVCLAFIGPRPPKMDICHRDNNKENNSLENLRYDTREGNLADSKSLATHCGRGHEIKEPNIPKCQRRCLACSRAKSLLQGQGREMSQSVADAYYREILGEPLPGDEIIMQRKFKRSK